MTLIMLKFRQPIPMVPEPAVIEYVLWGHGITLFNFRTQRLQTQASWQL
jgi:hypothetical protein